MAYRSPLGFNDGHQRYVIREKAFTAARVAYEHRSEMTYTEGFRRWSGITEHRRAYKHEFPPYADCSAFVTWCLWDATRAEKSGDFVNGLGWAGGYTGTMTQHGEPVDLNALKTADAIFYGGSHEVPAHVALYIGSGKVISHGQEGDPRIYPIDLNGALPLNRAIRYIR
jgi:cell wall-associated NlpC family hydrolase